MLPFPPLLDATFVSRPNRYLIVAQRKGRLIEAACRDPGRLDWLLRPGLPLARAGGSALLAFVVQRDDALAVSPHADLDPDFTEALVDARRAGVRLLGFRSRVDERGAAIVGRLPVVLPR